MPRLQSYTEYRLSKVRSWLSYRIDGGGEGAREARGVGRVVGGPEVPEGETGGRGRRAGTGHGSGEAGREAHGDRVAGRAGPKSPKGCRSVVRIRNVLAHANYEQAAIEAGLQQKDDYFKTGVYLSQVETLYRIVNRIIKQIDRDTGKPHDRANPGIRDFLESPDFLDLSKPADDEKP